MNNLSSEGQRFSAANPKPNPMKVGRPLNQHPQLSNTPIHPIKPLGKVHSSKK